MQDISPVLHRHIPFFFNIHDGQVNRFLGRHIIGELHFGFNIFPDSPVHILDRIGGIDNFTDLYRKVKIAGEMIPVGAPALDSMFVF